MENWNNPAGWSILLTGVEAIGDYGAKVQNPLLTFGGYNLLAGALFAALKSNPLSLTNTWWDGISNVMTLFIGVIVFGETLTSRQAIGAALVTLGLFLVGTGKGGN